MAQIEAVESPETGMFFLSDDSRSSSLEPEPVQSSPELPSDYQPNGTSSQLVIHKSEGQSSHSLPAEGGVEQDKNSDMKIAPLQRYLSEGDGFERNSTTEMVKHNMSKGMSLDLDTQQLFPSKSDTVISGKSTSSKNSTSQALFILSSPCTPETPHICIGCSDAELLRQQIAARDRWVNVARPLMRLKTVVQALSPFILFFKQRRYPWIQLAGHQGNFTPGSKCGTIVKKSNAIEHKALTTLMSSELRPYVPELLSVIEKDGAVYIEMVDLLREFKEPAVMDIKMGVRTYLESELIKERVRRVSRQDLYEKMIGLDQNEPTEDEHAEKGVTKPRYMQWRETLSSTSTLGFRIEGVRTPGGKSFKGFKKTRTREEVLGELRNYLSSYNNLKDPFLQKMMEIRNAIETSEFFRTHEVVGSSLLFLYDNLGKCDIYMIDYGKTIKLPPGISVDHRSPWVEGNHEDGYLLGLDNLIELWEEL